jgi:hypothetical protein
MFRNTDETLLRLGTDPMPGLSALFLARTNLAVEWAWQWNLCWIRVLVISRGGSLMATALCKVTPVILCVGVSPDSGHPTRGCIPRTAR